MTVGGLFVLLLMGGAVIAIARCFAPGYRLRLFRARRDGATAVARGFVENPLWPSLQLPRGWDVEKHGLSAERARLLSLVLDQVLTPEQANLVESLLEDALERVSRRDPRKVA